MSLHEIERSIYDILYSSLVTLVNLETLYMGYNVYTLYELF